MSFKIREIKNLNPSHLHQCVKISNSVFGIGYHSNEYFIYKKIDKIIAFYKGEIIGFLIVKKSIKTIIIDSIAIAKDWQRKKIGTSLLSFYFKEKTTGKEKVSAYAWKVKNNTPAGKLNSKFGLKPIQSLGKIWEKKCNVSFHCIHYTNSCKCECIYFSN